MNRREFLTASVVGTGVCMLEGLLPVRGSTTAGGDLWNAAFADQEEEVVEARYYTKLEHQDVLCRLCPRECRVGDRERGYCGVRENRRGVYYTLVYNRLCAEHVDPIEKKPFFHFHPGTFAYSIATAGCNMNCKYCQNWDISQVRPEQVRSVSRTPGECAAKAKESGALSVCYTYSEPTVFYEYMYDTSEKAKAAGLKNIMVSAGFISKEPLVDLCAVLDAVKIDLKAFSDSFYKTICRGKRQPVLDAMKTLRSRGLWMEIVYLVVPTLNDSPEEMRQLSRWALNELGPDVPLHLSRFFPTYLLTNLPPTPVDTLERLHGIAREEGLHYVYIGNVPGHALESTYCHGCATRVIKRSGYNVTIERLTKGGLCQACSTKIPGIWA